MRISFALLLLLAAAPVRAWGPLGHRVVAALAQERLSPQAQANLAEILGPGRTLAEISNCADNLLYVRGEFVCAGLVKMTGDIGKHTQPWHFINLPASSPAKVSRLMRSCPYGQHCVSEQVKLFASRLKTASSDHEKRFSLMFLVHLVADEHQPMHAVDAGDRGGNAKPINFLGCEKTLHSLWDDLVAKENWKEQASVDPEPLLAALRSGISGFDTVALTAGDFIDRAAVESHGIAREVIYPSYASEIACPNSQDYQRRMQPIVHQRLGQAAVRLAALLEAGLAGSPRPSAASLPSAEQAASALR
ncbi:MAG: S1/P1 nuclease [Elusimicrobiota bacterium]